MTILYLQSELMGYHIPVLLEYINTYNADVHVIHWDKKKLTPYIPPKINGITYHKKSSFNRKQLLNFISNITPDIIRVSGWMDKDYVHVCKKLKGKNIPLVVSSDTQLKKSIKQKIGRLYFKYFMKSYFDYIWVAGPYQFEYARKLGFNKNKIIFNCLTADTNLFSRHLDHNRDYPHKFLYLGRFEEIKGIKILLKAWDNISDKNDWDLTFIGNGNLKNEIVNSKNVFVKDFLQPENLANEIKNYGVLVLPSKEEPWALVIHEALASGLPVIATQICGAVPVFMIDEYNGYIIKENDFDDLKHSLEKVIHSTDEKLFEMSEKSALRSKVISPEIAAASFMSLLKNIKK